MPRGIAINGGPPTNCTECGERFKNSTMVDSRKARRSYLTICPRCSKRLKAEKQRKKQENNPT